VALKNAGATKTIAVTALFRFTVKREEPRVHIVERPVAHCATGTPPSNCGGHLEKCVSSYLMTCSVWASKRWTFSMLSWTVSCSPGW
jgi:hypothetical protein